MEWSTIVSNNLRIAFTGLIVKKVIDLANAPDDTRTVVGPIPPYGPMSWEVFCASAFMHRFFVAEIPLLYRFKSGGVSSDAEGTLTISDFAFVWITLLGRSGVKKSGVSQTRYDQAIKYLTHTLIGHADFQSHLHGVNECEVSKAVIVPSSNSDSSEAAGSDDDSTGDSSDESSSESSSESSESEARGPTMVPASPRTAAPG